MTLRASNRALSTRTAVLALLLLGGTAPLGSGQVQGGNQLQRADARLDPVEASRVREAALETLLNLADSADAQVRANAIEGLLAAPARLATVLPAALRDPNLGVRSVAAVAVGRARLEQFTGTLRDLQTDPSPHVRASAIYALRRCGADVDPTPLGRMATTDPSARVRAHAAFLLGELGDEGTVALLRDASQRTVSRATAVENSVLQVQIAEALVKLGDAEQLHSLRAVLFPASPEELDATVLAVQVLAGLDDRAAIGQFRTLGTQRDPGGNLMPVEVRLAVAGGLGALGVSEFEPVAMETLDAGTLAQQMQAIWALGQIGSREGVRRLEALTGEGPERLRVAAAAAMLEAIDRD